MSFLDLAKKRRTIYALGTDTEHSKEDIEQRIREVMQQIPTAFNSQTTRAVVLFDEANEKFWDHIYDVQKDVLEGEMWDMMSGVMTGAKKGIGTVLFFEDKEAVEAMPAQGTRREIYKHNNNGNAHYGVWLALTDMGLGASLQHFNVGYEQGFDKATKEMFNLPDTYEMLAQMPFGSIEQEVEPKEHIDTEVQVQVFN